MGLSEYITDIELAINARDMREPIARALESLADDLNDFEIDAIPTANSTNLVESNGVYQLWSDLVDAETFLLPTDQIILGEKTITEPGLYDAYDDGLDGYSHVEVNEEAGQVTANLKPKYIYHTGSYYPIDDECDGYSEVHVEVDNSSLTSLANRTIDNLDPENNIDHIGPYAFYSCNRLQNVVFPVCTHIGSHAFEGCTLLSTISASICTELSAYAFANCSNMRSVVLNNLTYVPEGAFLSCSSLSYCALLSPISGLVVHHIASNAFANCYDFQGFGTSVEYESILPVKSFCIINYIGDYAFYNCSSFSREIYFRPYDIFPLLPLEPQIDISIGKCAFENCLNFNYFNIALTDFSARSEREIYPCARINTVRIKESAFRNCFNFSSFRFLTKSADYSIERVIIESNAFENCNNINGCMKVSDACWNSLEIHEAAFRNVNRLPIPLINTTYIGKYAFQNLEITEAAFGGNMSSYILSIIAPSESYTIIDNNAFKSASVNTAVLCSCYLNSMAFADCQYLSLVSLQGTCSLANYAFSNCLNLAAIYIDAPSVIISENTFSNTYLDLYSTFSYVNDMIFEPQILVRGRYYSLYSNNMAWSKYWSYIKVDSRY